MCDKSQLAWVEAFAFMNGFMLAACVIRLIMLQQYTMFGHQPLEGAEAPRKKQTYFTAGGVVLNCSVVTICCVANLYEVLCPEAHKNE